MKGFIFMRSFKEQVATMEHKKIRRMLVLFIVFFFISFSVGRFYVPAKYVLTILLGEFFPTLNFGTKQMAIVVLNIRLPRIIAASLVGMSLSSAGAIYQGIFRNPMVSPDILGSSAGAGFGAALGILLGLSRVGIMLLAFAFGLLTVFATLVCTYQYQTNPILGLVLSGIMIGSLFSAGTSFIKLVADPTDQLPAITYWLMGSLSNIRMKDLYFLCPCVVIGLVPLFFLRWRLNLLTLGDEEAKALGVDAFKLRIAVILCSTLMTSACVAVSGMIGWVGLVVPHLARKEVGCDFKVLLPATLLLGGSFVILVDNLARTLTTSEIPIGILTAFIGTPFFLVMLLKGGKR